MHCLGGLWALLRAGKRITRRFAKGSEQRVGCKDASLRPTQQANGRGK